MNGCWHAATVTRTNSDSIVRRTRRPARPAALRLSADRDAIAVVLSDPKLKSDALHPNPEGHVFLAEKIYKELLSIGYTGL